MRAVLLIAFTYFSVLPLQRWLVGIGALLIVAGLAVRAFGHGFDMAAGSFLALMLGTMLLALMPVMLGGGMMRAASSRYVLHQLPWGRQRMLLGATLTVTALAGAATLMYMLGGAIDSPPGMRNDPFNKISPTAMFAGSWSLCAVLWVTTFITSGSQILSSLIGLLPLSLIVLGKTVGRNYAGPVPEVWSLLLASAVIWAGFSLWYLRAPSIRRVIYGKAGVAAAAAADNPFARLLRSFEDRTSSTPSRAQATELFLLGSSSRLTHAIIGMCWVLGAGFFVLFFRMFMAYSTDAPAIPGNMLVLFFAPPLMISPAGIAWLMSRRCRMLWLRTGLDRAALFARAERSGLSAGLLALGIPFVAFTAFVLASWPDRAAIIGAFSFAQLLFCICLFYGGLSLTRGWAVPDVLLCLGFLALLALEILALQPWSDTQTAAGPTLLVLALLIPLLRWHARRRWLALDWRVARMPQMLRRL
jgi:hypothetical protein